MCFLISLSYQGQTRDAIIYVIIISLSYKFQDLSSKVLDLSLTADLSSAVVCIGSQSHALWWPSTFPPAPLSVFSCLQALKQWE